MKPQNVKMATAISDEDWDIAVRETEMIEGWLEWTLGWMPGVNYQLWLARTYAFARGMQHARKEQK